MKKPKPKFEKGNYNPKNIKKLIKDVNIKRKYYRNLIENLDIKIGDYSTGYTVGQSSGLSSDYNQFRNLKLRTKFKSSKERENYFNNLYEQAYEDKYEKQIENLRRNYINELKRKINNKNKVINRIENMSSEDFYKIFVSNALASFDFLYNDSEKEMEEVFEKVWS